MLEKLSLNTATVRLKWDINEMIDGCVRHGIKAICPWRDQIAKKPLKEIRQRIDDSGLVVNALCRGGFFPANDKKSLQKAIDENKKALDEAMTIGAQSLVLVVGSLPPESKNIALARQQVEQGISKILDYSRSLNIPLAIEPLHPMYAADRSCVNTLSQALDLCETLGDGVGVAIDVYHVWWDPKLSSQIKRAQNKILGFHICDWLKETQDLLVDRGMMGDGIIDISAIYHMVEQAGYKGYIEVEIFSDKNWWQRNPNEVLSIIKERVVKILPKGNH